MLCFCGAAIHYVVIGIGAAGHCDAVLCCAILKCYSGAAFRSAACCAVPLFTVMLTILLF